MESSTPLLIVASGRFGVDKVGNHHKLTLHGGKQPPEEAGPRQQ
jgi:hypothetical protein